MTAKKSNSPERQMALNAGVPEAQADKAAGMHDVLRGHGLSFTKIVTAAKKAGFDLSKVWDFVNELFGDGHTDPEPEPPAPAAGKGKK